MGLAIEDILGNQTIEYGPLPVGAISGQRPPI